MIPIGRGDFFGTAEMKKPKSELRFRETRTSGRGRVDRITDDTRPPIQFSKIDGSTRGTLFRPRFRKSTVTTLESAIVFI